MVAVLIVRLMVAILNKNFNVEVLSGKGNANGHSTFIRLSVIFFLK